MRASLLMHLPMLTMQKRMGDVGAMVSKVGLTINGVYGEGQEALAQIYRVSNQVALGRTEQDLISAVAAVGQQLTDMELALRAKALRDMRLTVEDTIFRAWGALSCARLMELNEFFKNWSAVRLGAAMGLLPVSMTVLDALLVAVQDNNLCAFAEKQLEGQALQEMRAKRIREALGSEVVL